MPTAKITASILVATFLAATSAYAKDSSSTEEPDKEKCTYIYEGKHSKFGYKKNGICWQPPRGALKIEDTSWRHPLGGPNSIGNEMSRKLFQKPGRWLRKRLGL